MGVFHEHEQHTIFPLTFPVWEDHRTPMNALKLSGIKPPTWVDYLGSQVLAFSYQGIEANEEIVYFSMQMPHTWKLGSSLRPHIHWGVEDGLLGDAFWQFTYTWANEDGLFPANSVDEIVTNNPYDGVAFMHLQNGFTVIDGTGKEESSMLLCSLKRHSSDALDTIMAKDIYLFEFDCHYQVERPGTLFEHHGTAPY